MESGARPIARWASRNTNTRRTPDAPSVQRFLGHHTRESTARLGLVKARRFASTPLRGAGGLDEALGRARSLAIT